ncbi:MAG: Gfo/Idh/MocA family oxidoreductase [Clostridia bacterium]|nr:Gfo/Idh/MocA family oxidoreductase [Clostridia bacterium]
MIKVAIIGCGKISEVRHAPEYKENPDCELVGYYDMDPKRAQALADQFGGKVFATLDDVLSSDVDAVSVCVANVYHAETAIKALNAGKHVLCEKPMATRLEDCEAMVKAAKDAGKFLMIGQNQRLARAHAEGKKILDSGEVGSLIAFETSFRHPGPEGWTGLKNSWFFDKKAAAFGAMADLGVHKTDLICWLSGQRIVKTFAVLSTLDKKFPDGSPITVDDNAVCTYTLGNGVVGTMSVSWTNYGQEQNSTRLYCTGGVIRMYDDPEYSLIVEKRDGTVIPYELDKLTSNKEQTSGARTSTGVIDAFVESIRTGTPPAISAESVLPAMKAVFANQRSSETGCAVEIG